MSTAFISEWVQFTDTKVTPANGAIANYGGTPDYLKEWSGHTTGAATLTQFFLNLRTAPQSNWKTQVAVTTANDKTLLTENNALTQVPSDQLTQAPKRANSVVPASAGTFTYNGFGGWNGTNVL
jgi:hypothetical protein